MKDKKPWDKIIEKAKNIPNSESVMRRFLGEINAELLENSEFIEDLYKANPKFRTIIELDKEIDEKKPIDIEEYLRDSEGNLILSDEEIKEIPQDPVERYKYAKKLQQEEKYEVSKRLSKSIVDELSSKKDQVEKMYEKYKGTEYELSADSRKASTRYNAKFLYYFSKVKNGELLTDEEKDDIENLIQEDQYQIDPSLKNISGLDFINQYFEKKNLIQYKRILAKEKEKYEGGGREKSGESEADKEYIEGLSPIDRIEFFERTDIFGEEPIAAEGKDKRWEGYIAYIYPESKITIIEKFFKKIEKDKDGKIIGYKPNYGDATYLMHDDAEIDLEVANKGDMVQLYRKYKNAEERGEKKLVDKAHHTSLAYYTRLEEKFEKMREEEQPSIEKDNIDSQPPVPPQAPEPPVPAPEPESVKIEPVDENQPKADDRERQDDIHIEKPTPKDENLDDQIKELDTKITEKQKENEEMREKKEQLKEKIKQEMETKKRKQLKDKANQLSDLENDNEKLKDEVAELEKQLRALLGDNEQGDGEQ